jgi:hypothetical protein
VIDVLSPSRRRLALVAWLALASVACACNIPVFRYALERWRPDPCEFVVFYQGELTDAQQKLIESLSGGSEPSSSTVNVKVVTANLQHSDGPHALLWQSLSAIAAEPSLPYVVVRTQLGPGRVINGWHGPLSSIADTNLLQSPARLELSRRLLAGHSVVWILLTSKDREKTEQARQLLSEQLEPLSNKIELPEGIGLPGSELHSEIPLLLKFSLLEIDRDDAKEAFLVQLFTGFQRESVAQGEPLIIPVFGRGRALEVIPGSEMTPRLMEDLTAFLSGPCSCQVKDQNPGFDLLLSVDWNSELFGEGQQPPPERTTRDRQAPVLLTIPPGTQP